MQCMRLSVFDHFVVALSYLPPTASGAASAPGSIEGGGVPTDAENSA